MTQPIAHVLLDSARARAMSARRLAAELAEPVGQVIVTMCELAQRATGRSVPMPQPSDTFDQVLASAGRPSAAGSFGGRSQPLHMMVPTPTVLEAAIIRRPDLAGAAWVRRWRKINRTAVLGTMRHTAGLCTANGYPSPNYKPPGTPGLYRMDPDINCRWTVEAGDNLSTFAYWITGQGTPARVGEIIAANPTKKTVGTPGSPSHNFASLVVGEKIYVPRAWNQFISENGGWGSKGVPFPVRPAAEPIPSSPTPGGTTYAATLPLGAIAAAKVQLGTWAQKEKIPGLSAYPSAFDLNDAIDEAFKAAVRSFQQWSVARSVTLRTDGVFDAATDAALKAYVVGLADPAKVPPPVVATDPTKLPPLPAVPELTPTFIPATGGGGKASVSDAGASGALLLLALAGFFLLKGGR